jgi:transglutaminase-like putative cysteine protease
VNGRLTMTAAIAVVLASLSLFTVIGGLTWMFAGIGAVIVVAAAGLVTRLGPVPAAATAAGLVLIAVVPVFGLHSWAARTAGLALVAIVAASASVRRVLPVLAGACTYLAALLIYLNVVFASAWSAGWVVPTGRSFSHLAHIASVGYAEHNFAPPVPGLPGLNLIAAAGIGVIAIVTDLVAVRLRSPAVAGLPLLVLFSVPVATNVKHEGLGLTVAFCIGISGYLALLAADGRQRLRLWGRLVTAWQDGSDDTTARGPDTRQLAASGRRIGLAAVAIAVVVPLVLPGLKQEGLFGDHPGVGHGDLQPPTLYPLVQMRSQLTERSPQPVLTYRTNAADPPQQYLQVYVLNYNPATLSWTLAGRIPYTAVGAAVLRAAPGLSIGIDTATIRTAISIGKAVGSARDVSYLPLPYAPEYLKLPGQGWVETNSTLMVYAYRPDAGLSYTVTSQTAEPTLPQLSATTRDPASITAGYGTYLGPDNSKLLKIARQIVAGAHTKIAEALALQNWFTTPGRFTYSLTGSLPTGPNAVYQFLTTDKRGFCQQFAFSMAVLARLLGIPSRIAVGYTAGTRTRHGVWKVTTADAHAWPELYFSGVGWVRFEPTPGGATAQGTATKPVYPATVPVILPSASATPTGTGVTGPSVGTPGSSSRHIDGPGPGAGGGNAPAHGAGSGGFPIGLVIALVVLLLIATPGLTRALTRRRRWLTAAGDAGRAHAAWRELTSDLTDLGLSRAKSESPRALGRRIASARDLDGADRQALDRVTAAEERARYARTPGPGDSLQRDVQTVRRALARTVTRRQRWRAWLLPASVTAPVLAGLRQIPDAFGWLDAAGLGARHRMDRRLRARRAG